MINHLIETSNETDSKKWLNMEIKIKVETILGNLAVVPA